MNSLSQSLRLRVIVFQKKIIELKSRLQEALESSKIDQKNLLLEELAWFDSIVEIIEMMQSQEKIVQVSGNPFLLKNLERLKQKMQRHFENNTVYPIKPLHIEDEKSGIKIIETRPDPHLQDGTVIETIRVGYKWKGLPISKAEVVTVKN